MAIDKKIKRPAAASELRRSAEEQLKEKMSESGLFLTNDETQRLLHELQIHQIELEMQNEELRRALEELEKSRNKYAELYDFAPVGYFTFDPRGLIREVNLTGAQLLGIERRQLVNKSFSSYIADAVGREVYSRHLENVLQIQGMQRCEIRLRRKDGTVIHGQLQSITVETIEGKNGYIISSIIDGTIAKQLETEIQDARKYAEIIIQTVPTPLVVLNSDLEIILSNQSFYSTFKVTPEETIGNFIYDLGNRQWDIPKLRVFFEVILPLNTVINDYEAEYDFIDIGRKIILLSARKIFLENVGSHCILLAMEDITERKEVEITLRHENTHDSLTGLYNRSLFDEETQRLARSRMFPVSIVMADINGLKAVNDTLGHEAGDNLIRLAARLLLQAFRAEDIVARIGGDEFGVLLPGTDEKVAEKAVSRIINCPEIIDGQVSIAFGIASAEKKDRLAEALKLSDERMYRHKSAQKEL